jgi:hypothetical protein
MKEVSRMNIEMVNNRISQLPVSMAGIVHAFLYSGRGLSNFNYMVVPSREVTCLPARIKP